MTRATTAAPVPAEPATGPVTARLAVPRVAPQRRWRPALFWLAVALVAIGGLIGWRVLATVGSTAQYLAVARTVEAGATLDRADVTTVRINVDPALRPIRATGLNRVVGKHAAMRLVPGTLLTEAQLTDQTVPGPGQQLVGISLSQDRLPSHRLKPGAQVLLIITTDDSGGQPQQPAAGPPLSITATVRDVSTGARSGTVLINVEVPERDGPLVAARAAAGRIVVVLTSGG